MQITVLLLGGWLVLRNKKKLIVYKYTFSSGYCWMVRDYCGWCAVAVVWAFAIFVSYSTTKFAIVPMYNKVENVAAFDASIYNLTREGKLILIIFLGSVFMLFWCHLTAMLSDPGVCRKFSNDNYYLNVYNEQLALFAEDEVRLKKIKKQFCKKCASPKPLGFHHCSTCGRCIGPGLDHHCPWVNNCVAQRNLKPFVLFYCVFFIM